MKMEKRGRGKWGSVLIRGLYVATDESICPQKVPPNAVPDSNSNCNSAFLLVYSVLHKSHIV